MDSSYSISFIFVNINKEIKCSAHNALLETSLRIFKIPKMDIQIIKKGRFRDQEYQNVNSNYDPFLLLLSFNKQIVITTRSSSSYHLINK
jgi:hypothetical protein